MILQKTVPGEFIHELQQKNWYRHGIYRSIFLWAFELLPSLGLEYFKQEGVNKGLDNAIQMGKDFFITHDEFENFCQIYSDRLNDGTNYLKKYIVDYNKDIDLALAKSKRLGEANISDLKNEELAKIFLEHFDCIRPLHHWLWSMEFLNESFDRKIRAEIARVYPNWTRLETDNFLSEVSYVHKRQYFQQEKDDIAALPDLSKENVELVFGKYRWMNMCFIDGNPFAADEYSARVKEMFDNKSKLISDINQNKTDADRSLRIANSVSDEQLKEYIFLMQELSYLKTYRIDAYTLSFYFVHNLRTEIMKRLKLSLDDFLLHTIEEIVESLNGRVVPRDNIADRREWCMVKDGDKLDYFKSSVAVDSIRKAIWDENKKAQSLRGTVAYKGFVRGRVRVSFSSKDIDEVQPGEILVCNLTNPDYNPVFNKVAGIITDEGGVLCHSAIMAREFKIPCVINTKIATQVLRTGDMVELDAENGVVNLIE